MIHVSPIAISRQRANATRANATRAKELSMINHQLRLLNSIIPPTITDHYRYKGITRNLNAVKNSEVIIY